MNKFAVLLLAAGKSTRFGDKEIKKPFAALEDRAVWLHSVERFLNRDDVAQVILVIAPEDKEDFQRKFGANLLFMNVQCTVGGEERSDSVKAGLEKVSVDATHVAVHDAARPCVSDDEIDRLFAAAIEHEAAILATPVASTLKLVKESASAGQPNDCKEVDKTISRENVWAAQTPQAFEVELLRKAHSAASDQPATDDAQLIERLKKSVAIVEGSSMNLKITTKDDLKLASAILRGRHGSLSGSKSTSKPEVVSDPFADDDLWD